MEDPSEIHVAIEVPPMIEAPDPNTEESEDVEASEDTATAQNATRCSVNRFGGGGSSLCVEFFHSDHTFTRIKVF